MSGYMDLSRPRVYRRSNVGLVPSKVTKFGTKVGLNMLMDIYKFRVFHDRQKNCLVNFFFAFSNFAHGKSPLALSRP